MSKINKMNLMIGTIVVLLICGCSNEEFDFLSTEEHTQKQEIILQTRSSSMPCLKKMPFKATKNRKSRSINSDGELIGNSDVILGYSYSVGNSFQGSMENVKFPVLDLAKIKAKYQTAVTSKQLNQFSQTSFSHAGMSRYESKSQVSKIVKSDIGLNLGLFKIGRERKLTELFKSDFSLGSDGVCGELNLEVISGQFELLATSDKLKEYARECLTSTFLTDLYRGSIGSILDSYGHFVIRGYYTGGKAMALYAGKSDSATNVDSMEKKLDNDMKVSFSWKSDSASGNLTFGHTNGSSLIQKYQLENTQIYIKTFGGNLNSQVSVGPTDLKNLSVDLSSWLNSLNDKQTNTLIDFTSGDNDYMYGLIPLSSFVLEKNFRYRIYDTSSGLLESYTDVLFPRFEIVKVLAKVTPEGENLYEVAAVLNTRQGDKIVLSNGVYKNMSDSELRENNSNEVMMSKVQEIFAQKKNIFQGLEFTTNYSTQYDPVVRKPLCIRLDGFNENNMAFYADPNSNMRYIYDATKKIALAYNEDEDYGDYVLDFYGIREWVESLPKRKISTMMLQLFTVIGL